ncbi:MAG: GNAT family N-acetyltransferase [Candidatus Kaelpia aquatica]|nr:GNAT family N-acetyltransferase [Candidatus Kaelpia aquatica]
MDKYVIRQYDENDLNDVLSSWEDASKIAHPFLTEEFQEKVRHDIPNVYLPNADTWVVEQNGQVFGFMALIGNEVGAIFIKPEFQGRGAGQALMDKAQELCGNLEVEVFKDNKIGQKFYFRYGFEILEEKVHEPTGNKVLRLKLVSSK